MKFPQENWEQFVGSICVHLIIPLLPVILVATESISLNQKEMHLFTTMWAFHICDASKNRIMKFIFGVWGIILLGMLQESSGLGFHNLTDIINDWHFTNILGLLCYQIYERIKRHLINGEKYF